VHAFIEKEECSKEEKTFGQSWEIAQTSYFVSMLVFAVHLLAVNEVNLSRKWKIPTASLKTMPMMPLAGLESSPQWEVSPNSFLFLLFPQSWFTSLSICVLTSWVDP
jgi:hypothetical protein